MSRWRDDLPPDLREVLEEGLGGEAISAPTRARAVARARAAVAAWPEARESVRSSRGGHRMRWAAAAAIGLLAAATSVAAAYQMGKHEQPVVEMTASPVAPHAAPHPRRELVERPAEPASSPASPLSASDDDRGERHLLNHARAAVARGAGAVALSLLSEHARRFRNGRFVEEREALRVKALAELGRRDDAQNAARDFQARFPRSPLLSAVDTIAGLRP